MLVPLKVNVEALHAGQRGATKSVPMLKAKAWLESEAGLEWAQERKILFSAGEQEREAFVGVDRSTRDVPR